MPPLTKQKQVVGFVGWLVISFSAAAIGAAASIRADAFYAQLAQPDWAPPAQVFGPVWTVLYALMGTAAWLVWRAAGFGPATLALALFCAQLALNALWSWLFFGWHQGALALADIFLLFWIVAATSISFWRIKPLAGMLFVPYLLWAGFAAALNYSVWRLNPTLL